MARRIPGTLLLAVLLVAATLSSPVPNATAGEGDWGFDVGLYGWLPTIGGTLQHDIPGVGDEVTVDPGTLIDNLSFTAMVAFDVKYKKWALVADMVYLKETASDSKTLEHIGQPTLTADYKLNSWIVNVGGRYEIGSGPEGAFGVVVGGRYFSAESTLRITSTGAGGLDETLHSAPAIWNFIIGSEGKIGLGKNWSIPYYLDIGSGGSDFTWQGMAGVGYDFKWGGLAGGYRYLSFDQGDGSEVRELTMGGFELGIFFKF